MITDAALADMKDRVPCNEIAGRWVTLRKSGAAWIGPCPLCSRDRTKRTSSKFKATADRWMCAACMDGGDVIELVRKVEGLSFNDAITWLGGAQDIDAAAAATRKAQREGAKAKAAQATADFRERERGKLYEMWKRARPATQNTPIAEYLALRGLGDAPIGALRCIVDMPYYESGEKDAAVIARAPAMLAAFTRAGKFSGLHITWLDGKQPNGKLCVPIEGANGELWPAKKMRGSKAGAHIELVPPHTGVTERIFIGEGIETTLSVWCALDSLGLVAPTDAFWCAGDLGNLGGRSTESVAHPTLKDTVGRPRKVGGAIADLASPAVVIPATVTQVIILGDGDSDPFITRCTLARACARMAKAGRTVRIAFAPEGQDFNDLWRATRDASTLCALIDSGQAPTPHDVGGRATQCDSSLNRPHGADTTPTDVVHFGEHALPAIPEDEQDGNNPSDLGEIAEDTFRACAELDHSDTDNGTRLIRYLGRDLLVRQEDDVAVGQWLAWSRTHWDLAGGEALAHLLAQRVGDLIKIEARYMDFTPFEARAIAAADTASESLTGLDQESDDAEVRATVRELRTIVLTGQKARNTLASRRSDRRKHGVATKNAARIASMLKCAAPRLRRHPDDFNADQLKVATLTHTLSFQPILDMENPDPDGKRVLVDPETGRTRYRLVVIKGHDRADLLTAVIPFGYISNAHYPDYVTFLNLFQPEPKKRRTLQQYAGMGLTAQPVQRIMFHTGSGGNGKSVFLEVMTRVLGDGLAVGIPSESVSGSQQNNPSAPTPDIARCYGKRFLRVAEMPKGEPLKQNTIKKLTGGERWPVRTMYKGYFEFKPTAKPHMSGNDVPFFDGTDGGLKRRLIFMPWTVTLPTEKHRDFEEVVSEIVAGGSGILNWLIEGALDFLNNGLVISADVAAMTAEQFDEMDPCEQFIRAHVMPDEGGPGVTARSMYDAFKLWCSVNGRSHIFETRFGRTMKGKLKRDDTKRVRVYLNVKLHDLPEKKSTEREVDETDASKHSDDDDESVPL